MSNQPQPDQKTSTKSFIAALLGECVEKHRLHPLETSITGSYHLELTFSVDEIRQFLIENSDCWTSEGWLGPSNTNYTDAVRITHDVNS